MHIGLATSALPSSGAPTGVVTYVKFLREALQALGHRVTTIANELVEDDGGTVTRLPEPGGLAHRVARIRDMAVPHGGIGAQGFRIIGDRLLAAQRLTGFETLEIEESFGTPGPLAGCAPFPIVVRLHGPHLYGRDNADRPPGPGTDARRIRDEWRAIAAAAGVTSPSARMMAALLDHHGARLPLAETIPNPMPAATPDRRWTIDRVDAGQILCVGRFDLRKGADIVIEAFGIAAARDQRLRLVMAGVDAGIRRPDGSMVHYPEHARGLPPEIAARISFLGPVPPERIAELRLQSGITVVAARFESFAYSVAEAMAIGAPMIVSDTFGPGELIENERSGLIVPIGDAPALAAAILSLGGRPDRLAELGEAAWQRCRDLLDPARIAAETVAFHERALQRWRRSGGRRA